MATRNSASQLKDLDVDRVDGVDKPATGRSFLLLKSEDGASQIMKGYGAVSTAAHLLLKAIRTDKHATVSRKSAVAANGLAQILGQDPVFVGKSVPTQPYQFTEPDGDKRGPADEDLGGNFTPRSMPGSMVGSVQFRMKDEDMEDEDRKVKGKMYDDDEDEDDAKGKRKAKARKDEDEADDEEDAKRKARKARARKDDPSSDDEPDEDDQMDASERTNRGVARSLTAMAKAMEALPGQIVKALVQGPEAVSKSEDDENERPARRPASRQVRDEEPVQVRKSGGYEPRFGVSFSDAVFGNKR